MSAMDAMATWIGALARGGLLMGRDEEEGAVLALRVLGEEALSRLREWFATQPAEVVERERRGAIHACIWMTHADRRIVRAEMELLERIIAHSELPPDARDELEAAILEPQRPELFAEELTQPELRELILALGWALAHADGRVEDEEVDAMRSLAEAFDTPDERLSAIRTAATTEA